MYYRKGRSKKELALLFSKSETTIANWIKQYECGDGVNRQERNRVLTVHGEKQREWLVKQYLKNPTMFMDEAKRLYALKYGISIGSSTISVILKEAGLSWKALEVRAIQICRADVIRFCQELIDLDWRLHNLVFLDEVSFDNRNMLRKRGWWYKGERLILRSEYKRRPRVSLLCMIGLNGLLDIHYTEGTFTRELFLECCLRTATSDRGVKMYPGWNSVWIMDGAAIHCDPNLVSALRYCGIKVVFLPAYCPFFNTIEIFFGMVKRRLRVVYQADASKDLPKIVLDVLNEFRDRSFEGIYRKCGYTWSGFNPGPAFNVPLTDVNGFESDSEMSENE